MPWKAPTMSEARLPWCRSPICPPSVFCTPISALCFRSCVSCPLSSLLTPDPYSTTTTEGGLNGGMALFHSEATPRIVRESQPIKQSAKYGSRVPE